MLEILVLIFVISSFTTLVYVNVLILNAIKGVIFAKILKNRMNKVLSQKLNKEVLDKDENGIHNLDKWIKQNKEEGRNVGFNSHRSEPTLGA